MNSTNRGRDSVSSTANVANVEVQAEENNLNQFDNTYLQEAFVNEAFYEFHEGENESEDEDWRVRRRNIRLEEIRVEANQLNQELGRLRIEHPIEEETIEE